MIAYQPNICFGTSTTVNASFLQVAHMEIRADIFILPITILTRLSVHAPYLGLCVDLCHTNYLFWMMGIHILVLHLSIMGYRLLLCYIMTSCSTLSALHNIFNIASLDRHMDMTTRSTQRCSKYSILRPAQHGSSCVPRDGSFDQSHVKHKPSIHWVEPTHS